jgi:hypothetical protein
VKPFETVSAFSTPSPQAKALGEREVDVQRPSYSYLNATNGSTFVARRAGIKLASSATTNNNTETAIKVILSVGVTPNSNDSMNRVNANEAPTPMTIPRNVKAIPFLIVNLNT